MKKEVAVLEQVVKMVTKRDFLLVPKESFRVHAVDVSIDHELVRIDFNQFENSYSISVFDKMLQKDVSLNFWGDSEASCFVCVYKHKRTIAFWKKPSLQIVQSFSFEIDSTNEDNNEYIQFVLSRIPKSLLNLI